MFRLEAIFLDGKRGGLLEEAAEGFHALLERIAGASDQDCLSLL